MKLPYLAALWLLVTAPLFAQSAGVAGISGVVRDQSGAVVPDARVVISSESQGLIRTLTSNSEGVFTAPVLTPGPGYQVTVSAAEILRKYAARIPAAPGGPESRFARKPERRPDIHRSGRQRRRGNGGRHQNGPVAGGRYPRQIQDLPINGRRVDSFALLTPGVSNDGTFGLLSFRGVAGQNSFLVDGTDTTESFYNENAGRTRIAAQISQDAVQEFQVVSSNYSAEFGRAMGGIVNTVTKSGGNAFHGGGFWFYRSTGFDARDPFATFVPSEKRNQAGGTIGGPVKKDKVFFFLSTEITRRNFPMVDSLNTVAVNPTTQTWIGCGTGTSTQPAATAAQCNAINGLLPRFFASVPRTLSQELYLGKLDYHLNDHNSLNASFNFLHHMSPNGIQTSASSTTGSALNANGDDAVTVRNGHAAWTFIPTSTFVNEFRFGDGARDRQWDGFDQSQLGQGLGYLQVSVNGTTIGPASYLPRIEPMETRYQFQDNATWTKGAHIIKFGVDIATTRRLRLLHQRRLWHLHVPNRERLRAGLQRQHHRRQELAALCPDLRQRRHQLSHRRQRVLPAGPVARDRAADRHCMAARYEFANLPQPTVCNSTTTRDRAIRCRHPTPTWRRASA